MVKNSYICKRGSARPRPKLACGPGCTDASFEQECRIDRILYKYTHNLPLEQWQIKMNQGMFADFTEIPKDPAEIKEWYNGLQKKFAEMPAEIRRDYHDDIGRFAAALLADGEGKLVQQITDRVVDAKMRLNPTYAAMRKKAELARLQQELQKPEVKEGVNNNETPASIEEGK